VIVMRCGRRVAGIDIREGRLAGNAGMRSKRTPVKGKEIIKGSRGVKFGVAHMQFANIRLSWLGAGERSWRKLIQLQAFYSGFVGYGSLEFFDPKDVDLQRIAAGLLHVSLLPLRPP